SRRRSARRGPRTPRSSRTHSDRSHRDARRPSRSRRTADYEELSALRALQSGGASLGGVHGRHLPRRFVDHLVAEEYGPLAVVLGRLLVRLEDVLGAVVLLLRRSEDLVQDGDLVRVEGPLAVVAELPRPRRDLAVAVEVTDRRIRT